MNYDGVIVSSNRQVICPICKKENDTYCCIIEQTEDGLPLYICHRKMGYQNIFQTRPEEYYKCLSEDGAYVCVGNSRSGGSCFKNLAGFMQKHPRMDFTSIGWDTVSHAQELLKTEQEQNTYTYEPIQEPLDDKTADTMNRYLLQLLNLNPTHRQQMHERGFTDQQIADGGYRSIDDQTDRFKLGRAMERKFGNLTGLKGWYLYTTKKTGEKIWMINSPNGMLIPVKNIWGQITGFRIRLDQRWFDSAHKPITKAEYEAIKADAEKLSTRCPATELGKYQNLTSYKVDEVRKKKEHIISNAFKNGTQCGNMLHYAFPSKPVPASAALVMITEGEIKSHYTAEKLGITVIAVPGVNSFSLLMREHNERPRDIDILKAQGKTTMIVAYDSDKEHNEHVLRSEEGLIEALKAEGFAVAVAGWQYSETTKGIDDLLHAGGKPSYRLLK